MPLIRNAFQQLHYPVDIIAQCVRWYLAYALSLRNLEEIMAERGITVDHSTLHLGSFAWCRFWIRPFVGINVPWGTAGEWTKPTSKSKASGHICIAPSTARGRPSIFCLPPDGMRQQRCASSAKPSATRRTRSGDH